MNPNCRKLVMNEDDPFLHFFDYSQQKVDQDYMKNQIVQKHHLARRLGYKGTQPQLEKNIQRKAETLIRGNKEEPTVTDDVVNDLYNEFKGKRQSNQGKISTVKPKYEWMNDEYWRLPEKARLTIDKVENEKG